MHPIRLRRVYDAPGADDGFRVLVDRLWPRGLAKEKFACDLWLKEIAPSSGLRRWFGHVPERWEEFRVATSPNSTNSLNWSSSCGSRYGKHP